MLAHVTKVLSFYSINRATVQHQYFNLNLIPSFQADRLLTIQAILDSLLLPEYSTRSFQDQTLNLTSGQLNQVVEPILSRSHSPEYWLMNSTGPALVMSSFKL